MRSLISAVFGAALLGAAPALAWSDGPMGQPATNEIAVWAYPSAHNFCPAGLQPVTIGGVVCCGQPTHYGYSSHPAPARRAGTYVAYDKGYSGN
jgi:hypothetical protein